jgi:TolB-like protein/tetratricopeptide (TPR) repeat protein
MRRGSALSETTKAVFLSYASEDAIAAEKVCAALRIAGIEVWFDKRELRGGDAWDASIRQQIKNCTLFIPVISRNTQARGEGYFRLEWKLAVDRSHLIAADQAFLVPVVIDQTADAAARVPDRFREVQWTQLPGGETPPAFVERVGRLLEGKQGSPASDAMRVSATQGTPKTRPASARSRTVLLATIAVAILAFGCFVAIRFVLSRHGTEGGAVPDPKPAAEGAAATRFNPPPHSIAVLPFANMSGDSDQEYFSDGLTEELLNSLTAINGLQVAARTSAFSFKGTNTDIGTIARKLNVGAVLEGSVRRSAHTLRITAQLINSVTGFHLWSKTYDRNAGDVLKLQTEIATSVASALQVTLLGDVAAKVELGGTNNPAAFDAYLRGAKTHTTMRDAQDISAAIDEYTEALRLDPRYSQAYAARSIAFSNFAGMAEGETEVRKGYEKALADARTALRLAPDLAQAHLALAVLSDNTLDFRRASDEYERARLLAPGNAEILRLSGRFATWMQHYDEGIATTRRAVVLDPLARSTHSALGEALYAARRYEETVAVYAEVISLDPGYKGSYGYRGLAYYGLGDLDHARASCETTKHLLSRQCLAVVYDKLGRHLDAEAILSQLQSEFGDASAYQYSTIYAQWGDRAKALEWLETAWRLRDPGLVYLKTEPLLDPLRNEPRFQAIMRQLNFPD